MNRSLSLLVAATTLTTAALAAGCTAPQDEPTAQTQDDLRHGVVSSDLAAVGKVVMTGGFCTGTLIAPRVVLTAAHCFDHDENADIGRLVGGSFEITPEGGGAARSFGVDNFYARDAKVFGGGAVDIAILHLTKAVPSSLAAPITLAWRSPQKPERVYQIGYGCQNRKDPTSAAKNPLLGEKQMVSYLWGSDHEENCPGDSGGPTVLLDVVDNVTSYRVFRVTKAYQEGLFGGDRFTNVYSVEADLEAMVASWTRSDAAKSR